MCGIVGYVGSNPANILLLESLKLLEYRGYDSSGLAVEINGEIIVKKAEGNISNLEKIIGDVEGMCGIAHTRWATHGKPTTTNAHPHVSADNNWAVVHNGIIENFEMLRKEIEENSDIRFVSQTDTECIPQLLQYIGGEDIKETFVKGVSRLEGSYAIACLNANLKNTLLLAKRKSPLYVAIENGQTLVASDPMCFAGKFSKYYSMNDDEYCIATDTSIEFFDKNMGIIDKNTTVLSGEFVSVQKDKYPHYMLKEINEIPQVLRRISDRYSDERLFGNIEKLDLTTIKKIVFVGCGTAYHAGLMGAKFVEKFARFDCDVFVASEFRYSNPIIDKNTLCIFVSQSGETADTIGAMTLARSLGATTIALTNVLYSTLAQNVDIVLPVCAGPEIAVASTKAYNAQITILYMLARFLESKKKNISIDYISIVRSLADNIKIPSHEELTSVVDSIKDISSAFFIGRDRDYITSEEASLKLKEITYINSNAYPSGELKHGFLALVEKDSPVFVLATEKDLLDKTLSNAHEAYARGGKIFVFTSLDTSKEKLDFADVVIKMQTFEEELMPIVSIIYFQILAYMTSIARDINPDQPRNLAKSVTVE